MSRNWNPYPRERSADIATNTTAFTGLCTDRFQDFVLRIDGRECVRGDANGKRDYYRIRCSNAFCCRGTTVKLQLLTRGNNYLNLQYIGVEGTKAP